MVTVEIDPAGVERRLGEGAVSCPGCGGRLGGWGHARARTVRDVGGQLVVRPRRGRCAGCGVTHVLLPVMLLSRRADTAEVIGAGLAARAGGAGHRVIAGRLGRPVTTVRGWLRRFGARIEAVRVFFTSLGVRVAAEAGAAAPGRSPWADAVAAITSASETITNRFAAGAGAGVVTVWQCACAVSGGRLLAPSWPGMARW